MKNPNEMHRREDNLMGFEDANDMPGESRLSMIAHGQF
jgi:hypothetical protein